MILTESYERDSGPCWLVFENAKLADLDLKRYGYTSLKPIGVWVAVES